MVADPQRRSEGERELLARIGIAVDIIRKAIEEDPDPTVNAFRIPDVEGDLAEVLRALSRASTCSPNLAPTTARRLTTRPGTRIPDPRRRRTTR